MPLSNWHWLTVAGGTFESDTDGTFHCDIPGTFQSAVDGTFDSATDGTFQSDMGGTFGPLLSTDDFLRAGTAVCPEAIYTDVLGFQKSEESLMGVCLMKTHIRVAIAVLDIDYLVTDNIYARPVAEELFVGRFCIILSMIEKIPPKGVSFSDFICTFAMPCYDSRLFSNCNTKISEKSDTANS